MPKKFFTLVARSRCYTHFPKALLACLAKTTPVSETKVDKRAGGGGGRDGVEDGEEDGEVVGVEGDRSGPGERGSEVGRGEGDVRGRGGAVRRETSWGVEVEGDEEGGVDGGGEGIAARVVKGREPTVVMGVEVAHHDAVSIVEEVDERVSVEGVAGGA